MSTFQPDVNEADSANIGPFERQWIEIHQTYDARTKTFISALVSRHAAGLAITFYATLFADPEAARFLDHEAVNHRLKSAMQRWLIDLFDPATGVAALLSQQRKVGSIHARIGLPIAQVSRGVRILRRAICGHLSERALPRAGLLLSAQYVHELFALAADMISSAYSANTARMARSEEAYRLFFLGQDMRAERERRRSELLEWANQILSGYYWHGMPAQRRPQFGMWLKHKAAMLFDGASELAQLADEMNRVENELQPCLLTSEGSPPDARAVMSEIADAIERMQALLMQLFDRFEDSADDRDSVTALLNRRFFPAIVRREIEMSGPSGGPFALLMIDIDGFRAIGEQWGHDTSNFILAQAARLLQDLLRAGDFAFRIGEDEFLVLLVDCDAAASRSVAEGLRSRFEQARFKAAAANLVPLTISLGLAHFDGHPDYNRLLERADLALRAAQSQGGNRVSGYPA